MSATHMLRDHLDNCRRLVIGLSLAVLSGLGLHGSGCAARIECDPVSMLEAHFSAQAPGVLKGEPLTLEHGRYSASTLRRLAPTEAARRTLAMPGGLAISFPAEGTGAVKLTMPGGFSASVRDLGAEGAGTVVGDQRSALAFRREGGSAIWTQNDHGAEQWLLVDPQANRGGVIARYEVLGATLQQAGPVVELLDEKGRSAVVMAAPIAYGLRGRIVPVLLAVVGNQVTLTVDAPGEPLLVDPSFTAATSMALARAGQSSTLLADGRVLVAGGEAGGATLSSAQVYDPRTNAWKTVASMATPRMLHTATALRNGKVLLAGRGSLIGSPPPALAAEIERLWRKEWRQGR